MHITPGREHALNAIGAWALAVADAIHVATDTVTGISGAAAAALVAVAADPDLTIDDLRRALRLTHPGAVRLVDRLQNRGWLQRYPGRGRTVHLRLTTDGHRTHSRLLAARSKALTALTGPLEPGDLEQIARLIGPSLTAATTDIDTLRHLCRLCRRQDCEACPVAAGIPREPR